MALLPGGVITRMNKTKPLGMQASIFDCLCQARINWEGSGRKGVRHKNGGRVIEVGR